MKEINKSKRIIPLYFMKRLMFLITGLLIIFGSLAQNKITPPKQSNPSNTNKEKSINRKTQSKRILNEVPKSGSSINIIIEEDTTSINDTKSFPIKDETNKEPSIYEIYESNGNPIDELVKEANDQFTKKQYREAISNLKKASTYNHPEALLSLGLLFEKGLINEQDTIIKISRKNKEEAFFYIQRSARMGFKPAQKELARLYRLGIGTEISLKDSDQWMKIYEKPYDSTTIEEGIFEVVELQAEFPGGYKSLQRFLSTNIIYPQEAQENEIQGRVVVQFVVEKDGIINNATVIRGVDEDLNREALRVVNKMPRWIPGMNNGTPVRTYFNLPITFKLQNS